MRKQGNGQVTLSQDAQKTLFKDVIRRKEIEACGLLIGSIDEQGNWYIKQVHPLNNTYNSSVYFEFDPEEMLAIELAFPGQVVGAYHSHPGGYATASQTDRKNMRRVNVEQDIPWIWLIVIGPFTDTSRPVTTERQGYPLVIAYHHYETQGLQKVPILLEEGA